MKTAIFLSLLLVQFNYAGIIDLSKFHNTLFGGFQKFTGPRSVYSKSLFPPSFQQVANNSEVHERRRQRIHPAILSDESAYSNLRWIRVLGHGGFGSVSLEEDESTGELFAVKRIKPSGLILEDFLSDCTNEYKCHYMCRKNENVVKPKEMHYCEDQFQFLFVMEYCANGTLEDYLGKVREDLIGNSALLKPYFGQLLAGLVQIHSSGVAHRDIKPANILIDENGVLKYSDFGLSVDVTKSKYVHTSSLAGTPDFIAPEAFKYGRWYDPRKADVWALGITFYWMMRSEFPFDEARSDPEYLIFKEDPDYLLGPVSERSAIFKIIARMLTINPKRRPSAKELLEDPYFAKMN